MVAQSWRMITAVSSLPAAGVATHAALRGLHRAATRAAEAALAIAGAGTARPLEPGPAALSAFAAGPDLSRRLVELRQARLSYLANAEVLRRAEAATAALLRQV